MITAEVSEDEHTHLRLWGDTEVEAYSTFLYTSPTEKVGWDGGGYTSTGLQLRKEGQDKISETRRQLTDILAIRCQMFWP